MADNAEALSQQGNKLNSHEQRRVAILTYHHVWADEDPCPLSAVPGTYCAYIMLSHFEQQMSFLTEHGCSVITHSELIAWLVEDEPIPERAVLIDFDDNRLNVFDNAFPILRSFGLPATVFVLSSPANDAQRPWGRSGSLSMGWEELGIVVGAGWLIGAHTRTHANLDELYGEPSGPAKVKEEVVGSKSDIEANLGVSVKNFAYPEGRTRPEIEQLVSQHFEAARLWKPAGPFVYNTKQTERYRLVANNISALTSEAAFHQLIDRTL